MQHLLYLHLLLLLLASLTPDKVTLLSLKPATDPIDSSPFSDWSDADLTPCWFGVSCSNISGKSEQHSSSLSWSIWLKIAKGTVRGLAYLHECSPKKFVHGTIKPSNILLDNDFQPHFSDFGLSRLVTIIGSDQPSSSSGGFMRGALPYFRSVLPKRSNNYHAPEAHVPGGRPTQKWYVYSFGVLLLTGKSPKLSLTTSTSIEVPDVVRWVRRGFDEKVPLSDMVDPMLLQEVHAKRSFWRPSMSPLPAQRVTL